MSDSHREDIRAAADDYTQSMIDESATDEGWDCLDVEVWRRDGFAHLTRVEFILTLGGPTVSVHVDERDNVTFFHSWGAGPDGAALESIRLYDDQADAWIAQAEPFREQ